MPLHRPRGAAQPGWKWGPFTFRVPFYHTGICIPEFLQGLLVAGATGLGLVPLLTGHFGLTFEEAMTFMILNDLILCSSFLVFGEPFAPGWITPALPLALSFILGTGADGLPLYATSVERIQLMTAASLDLAAIVFLMGILGLGQTFFDLCPPTFKAGIVMGAALAAVYRVFLVPGEAFDVQPVSTLVALSICLILTFSLPMRRWQKKHRWLAVICSLGLLPGFVAAGIVGGFIGELSYSVEMGILSPPLLSLWDKITPFSIGWPSLWMFVEMFPLALMAYVILFGDLVTGIEVLKSSIPNRPDEKIEIDVNRAHYALAVRNTVMAHLAPFFPSQGALWTGAHVLIVQRWAQGRKVMDSLFSGISSYYVFGIPGLYLVLPLVTLLKPLMLVALALTLILTGFACAYVAIGIVHTRIERGTVILIAFAIAFFSPWQAMIIAILATLILVGPGTVDES